MLRLSTAICLVLVLLCQVAFAQPAAGPLQVSKQNPRYFADPSGKIVYLAGCQSGGWDIQDDSWSGYAARSTRRVRMDFNKYLDLVASHRQNLIRLWIVESASYNKGPTDMIASPMQFIRSGPGKALDGRPKYDLTKFDSAYFDRLRSAVVAARDRGIYVIVMLFEGFGSVHPASGGPNPGADPWRGHPFNSKNNINGINADLNGDGKGLEYHTLSSKPVVEVQKAYVRKVIDTVNDLDNVIYEIANESIPQSKEWQYDLIRTIKKYELAKPKQHPVLMSAFWGKGERTNPALFASPAEAIAPEGMPSPGKQYTGNAPLSDGRKVVIADADHIAWKSKDPRFPWECFVRGSNPVIYDADSVPFDWDRGVVSVDMGAYEPIRWAVGHTRDYANRMNLAEATPQRGLSSTGDCLAKPGSEYLVYQAKSGTFSVTLEAGEYACEWFDATTGKVAGTGSITAGGGKQKFTPPFSGHGALYLKAKRD